MPGCAALGFLVAGVGMADSPDGSPSGGPLGPGSPERFAWSRRYAAGLGGVRGLLITVLGDYLRPTGKPAPTSAFIEVMSRLGVEETACRQALIRAAADGWLLTKRSGRFTWWQLSPAFEQFLTMGAERIFGFTATQPDWDRRWLVVVTRAAEANRAARHLVRTRLRWSGFGALGSGVWISTHADRAQDAEIVLREAGVFEDCQIFRSEYLAGGDPIVIVRQAWDLDDVEQEYEAFLSGFTRQPSNDPLVRSTRLVHAWRRLALLDPALPMELLPARWIGARAAKLFRRQHTKWLPTATQEWERISSQAR